MKPEHSETSKPSQLITERFNKHSTDRVEAFSNIIIDAKDEDKKVKIIEVKMELSEILNKANKEDNIIENWVVAKLLTVTEDNKES